MKKNIKKTMLLLCISVPTIFIASVNVLSVKLNNEFDEIDFIKKTELKRIERIHNNQKHKIIFTKLITFNEKDDILYIQFDGMSSFVDLKTLITLEVNWENVSVEKFENKNVEYFPPYGLVYRVNNEYFMLKDNSELGNNLSKPINTLEQNTINEMKQKSIDKRQSELRNKETSKKRVKRSIPMINEKEHYDVPNISYKIPYAWWWASRDTAKKVGYYDLRYSNNGFDSSNKSPGLCEYVAMSNLLLFHELFSASGVFTNHQYNNYIEETHINNSDINNASPSFKNYSYNNPDGSLAKTLFQYTGKTQQIQQPHHYSTAINKFMGNSSEKGKFNEF